MDTQSSAVTYTAYFDISKTAPGHIKVIRRNSTVTPFDANKIAVAMTKAFLAVEGEAAVGSSRIHETVSSLTQKIADTFFRRLSSGGTIHIEDIQDQVELELMRTGEYKVAKAYVLYREERRRAREQALKDEASAPTTPVLHVMHPDGQILPLDLDRLYKQVEFACQQLTNVSPELIIEETKRNLFDRVPLHDV